MKKKSTPLLIFRAIIFLFVFQQNVYAQKVELSFFEVFKKRYETKNDTLYVVNFWATWCKPCIEELPYFEQCNIEFKDRPVKIILTNLDFNSRVKSGVESFIEKKEIKSNVVHIMDTDPNLWINQVDTTWSGAIPATVIIKNGKKLFFKEGEMNYKELREKLESFIIIK